MEHCLLPPPCANLFLQHLGSSTVMAKFAQHSAFFIPADFLFLLAHFFFLALILYFSFRSCCLPRSCVSLAGAAVLEMPLVVRSRR